MLASKKQSLRASPFTDGKPELEKDKQISSKIKLKNLYSSL